MPFSRHADCFPHDGVPQLRTVGSFGAILLLLLLLLLCVQENDTINSIFLVTDIVIFVLLLVLGFPGIPLLVMPNKITFVLDADSP